MSEIVEEKQFQLDWLKWLVVGALVAGAIYGNWYYSAESVLYRVIALIVVALVAGFVAAQTSKVPLLSSLLLVLALNGARLYGQLSKSAIKQL